MNAITQDNERQETPEQIEENRNRLMRYLAAFDHWTSIGYSYNTARALAAVLHGRDDDVKTWALNIMKTQTNLRLEDMI